MRDPDRFYISNPDTPQRRLDPLPPVRQGGGWLFKLFLLMLLGFAGLALYERNQNAFDWGRIKQRVSLCSGLPYPASGSVDVLDPSVMRRSDALFSVIEVRNRFDRQIAASLRAPNGDGHRYAMLHIAPGQNAALSAPVGRYELQLQYGDRWCGVESGFEGGYRVLVNERFSNEAGLTGEITLGRTAQGELSVSYQHARPELPPPVFSTGGSLSLDLKADAQGHYKVDGEINGVPVPFMLDTGATTTAVPDHLRGALGVSNCRPATSKTANGVTYGCMATVAEVRFGSLRAFNVEVMLLPNLASGESLLGMNVLRQFAIEQRNGYMRISRQ